MLELFRGVVIKAQSGFFTVDCDGESIICQLRGKLKKGGRSGDIAAIGDQVEITRHGREGMIENVLPRIREFVRLAPTARGVYRQVLLANPDQVVIVFACSNPSPHLRMLDRFLVITEKQRVPPLIVLNKVDLIGMEAAEAMVGHYRLIGYDLILTSVKTGMGIPDLHSRLLGKLSALAGPSGVGKSSLLNAIQPGLGAAIRDISTTTNKGRHTTVFRQMYPLMEGGFVIDTPGLRALALWDTEPEELDGYFPEIRPLVSQCAFTDCSHRVEPACAVRAAVEAGSVHRDRYDSYIRLRNGEE